MNTFTKNKQTGEFDVIGLKQDLQEGMPATVKKASGDRTTVMIGKTSKPFTAKFGPNQGRTCVIAKIERTGSGSGSGRGNGGGQACDECGAPGARIKRHDSSGIPGTVCPTCSRSPSTELSFA